MKIEGKTHDGQVGGTHGGVSSMKCWARQQHVASHAFGKRWVVVAGGTLLLLLLLLPLLCAVASALPLPPRALAAELGSCAVGVGCWVSRRISVPVTSYRLALHGTAPAHARLHACMHVSVSVRVRGCECGGFVRVEIDGLHDGV